MADLHRYLVDERHVDKSVIDKLKEDGIDHSTLPLLDEKDLTLYLPRKGDRLAARHYCKTNTTNTTESSKTSLLDRLRKKFSTDEKVPSNKGYGNKNAAKTKRTIEIGWLHYDESANDFKQVRAKSGGGTRLLRVDKSSKKDDILHLAKERFFPDDMSQKGPLNRFEITLCDFQQQEIGDTTLGELYESCGMRTLRLYMRTSGVGSKEDSDDDLPDITIKNPRKRCRVVSKASSPEVQVSSTAKKETATPVRTPTFCRSNLLSAMPTSTCTVTVPDESCETVNASNSLMGLSVPVGILDTDEQSVLPAIPIIPYNPSISNVAHYIHYQDSDVSFGPIEEISFVESCYQSEEMDHIQIPHQTEGTEPSSVQQCLPNEDPTPPPVVTEQAEPTVPNEPVEESFIVRRGNALLDLIRAFGDESILEKNIKIIRTLQNGEIEIGTGSGVVIDCLVEFWNEFYERCTTGLDEKVPCLRHDFKEQEWQACARIYLFGWGHFKYIPVLLSSHFIRSVTGGQDSDVTDAFMRYISNEERNVLQRALANYSSVETDDLLEVLDNHSCRKVPSPENLSVIVQEIAHKELVQEPMFVIDCWKYVLQTSPLAAVDPNELTDLYKESIPTNKAVVQRLVINAKKPSHTETSHHLKRYLREADRVTLEDFLRFTTGSNLLIHSNKVITIEFSEMTDFTRRPVSRTCTQSLTLPDNYANYPDFRAEMNKVLKSDIWVFDYV